MGISTGVVGGNTMGGWGRCFRRFSRNIPPPGLKISLLSVKIDLCILYVHTYICIYILAKLVLPDKLGSRQGTGCKIHRRKYRQANMYVCTCLDFDSANLKLYFNFTIFTVAEIENS